MAIPTLYKSTDASAPVLTGEVSKLIDLLDAVLVNGYGAKAAAGWTKPFTGTDKAVFRNSTAGTGTYVRIVDDNARFGSQGWPELWAYASMSDVDTGTDQFPTAANISTDPDQRKMMIKSLTTNSTARAWVALATNRWILLSIEYGDIGARTNYTYFIGDFPTFIPSDANNFLLGGGNFKNITSPSSTNTVNEPRTPYLGAPAGTATAQGYYGGAKQNSRGTVIGDNLYWCINPVTRFNNGTLPGGTSLLDYPHPEFGLPLNEVLLGEYYGTTDSLIRGRIPNLAFPSVDIETATTGVPWSNFDEFTISDPELGNLDCIYLGHSQAWNFNTPSFNGALIGLVNQDDGL